MGTPGVGSFTRLLAVLVVVACALVGCGSADPPADPVVLNVLLADDWASADAVVDAVSAFETDHPGVRVNLTGVPFSHVIDNVRNATSTATAIDVVQWHAFAAAAEGLARPVADLWEVNDVSRDDFVPGAVEDIEWGGELYGLPLDTNAMVLFVNEDLIAQAGGTAADVRSLDQLESLAHDLTTGDRFGIALSSSTWVTYGWIRAHGGEVVQVGEGGAPTFLLDSAPTVAALEQLRRLVSDEVATQPYARNTQYDAAEVFGSQLVAMHTSGSWDVPTMRSARNEGLRFAVVPMPTASSAGGTVLGGSSLFIPKTSEHPELAFEFMLHLTSDETMLRLAREEGRLPSLRSQLADPYFQADDVIAVVAAELERASAMKLLAYPEAQAAFSDAIEEVLSGRARSAAEALRTAQRIAEASVAS